MVIILLWNYPQELWQSWFGYFAKVDTQSYRWAHRWRTVSFLLDYRDIWMAILVGLER